MTLILTNDDGIDAPGIQALKTVVKDLFSEPSVVVAPQGHLSGCGHQVTTIHPINVQKRSEFAYAVGGTPADCTRLALTEFCSDVNWVFSGINAGGNLGIDMYISGTVAAVREAAMHGVNAIAISHYIKREIPLNWDLAIQFTSRVLEKLCTLPLEPGSFWNVNLPHLESNSPQPEIIFCQPCRQPLPVAYRRDGEDYYYTGRYADRPQTPGSDVEVCFQGNIAVTQLKV